MNKIKKQYYDKTTDTFWAVFKNGPEEYYQELVLGINVEYNKKSNVIGVEIQNFSRLRNFKSSAEQSEECYAYSNIGGSEGVPANYKANFLSDATLSSI